MNIGFYGWEPGLIGNPKTSAGNATWMRYLIDQFLRAGHRVLWMAGDVAPKGCLLQKTPVNSRNKKAAYSLESSKTSTAVATDCHSLDVIFTCWRWEMPEYPERQAFYTDQMSLLANAAHEGIPIIAFDGDHKISDKDMSFLKSVNADIYAPELFPRQGISTLIFPNPFDITMRDYVRAGHKITDTLVYVGNNYERYDLALKFIKEFSERYTVTMYGNWLDFSQTREHPVQVKNDFPNVRFNGRVDNDKVVQALATGLFTIHMFKPSYGETGFIAMRWLEAVAARVPAFVPTNMKLPSAYTSRLRELGLYVDDASEMIASAYKLWRTSDKKLLQPQIAFVLENCKLENWTFAFDKAAMRGR